MVLYECQTSSVQSTNTRRILEIWHQQAFIYSCYIYFAIPVNIMFPECTSRRALSKSPIRDLYISVGFWKDESIMVVDVLIFDFLEWLQTHSGNKCFYGRVLTIFKSTTAEDDKKWWQGWCLCCDCIVWGKSVSSLLLKLVISAEKALRRIKVGKNFKSFRYNERERESSLYCSKKRWKLSSKYTIELRVILKTGCKFLRQESF